MRLRYYSMVAGMLLLVSCSKELKVSSAPDFEVTLDKTSYKVGDEVFFNIKGGAADEISFYSGEINKQYAYKEGRTIDISAASLTMELQNSVQLGAQVNQLAIMYSTDFNGDYSSVAALKKATWTDITSRWPLATNATFVPVVPALPASQDISRDISALKVPGKPLYIGFRYLTKSQAANGIARQWFVQGFAIKSKVQYDGTSPIVLANQANAGFRIVDDNKVNDARALSLVTTSRITLQGNLYRHPGLAIYNPDDPMYDPKNPKYDPRDPGFDANAVFPKFVPFDPSSPYNDPEVEHWAISKAIDIDRISIEPDYPESIKLYNNQPLKQHKYIYTTPGTYKVVFVAANRTIDETKSVVREITVTITP
ncbi:hypothetical protein ABIE26_002670 [Pedobacter africanus]|uniref:Uncharacterized protein n=1 Tax=Pedobacter africanus TaxID=151894 RepID=A0ACC6KXH6_9SPHI|nr:DUF5017 domain-containing protein [Pedobacter africanus]MDR6783941.1 hypothetical protein [Pedobacter africanus]